MTVGLGTRSGGTQTKMGGTDKQEIREVNTVEATLTVN